MDGPSISSGWRGDKGNPDPCCCEDSSPNSQNIMILTNNIAPVMSRVAGVVVQSTVTPMERQHVMLAHDLALNFDPFSLS